MFTGIVERTARVQSALRTEGGLRLEIHVTPAGELPPWRDVELGESIAINGVCLTVVDFDNPGDGTGRAAFEAVPETLEKTNLGELREGDLVNVERSLRVGDSFGGHYVTGHVDGTGVIESREREGDQVLFAVAVSPDLIRQMLPKGSIVVDGISLTLIEVDREAPRFTFAAIPHTLERTQLGAREVGARVNIETDAFGKWVLHGLETTGLLDGSLGGGTVDGGSD